MARRRFDMDSVTEEIGFGKYEYATLWDIMHDDIDYTAWLKSQNGITFSDTLSEFIREVYKQYDPYRADGRTFQEIYDEYLAKEHRIKEEKNKPKTESSGLDSKLNLLNAIANNAREQAAKEEQYAQQEWLEFVVNYFDSCKMEDDTESGKLKWIVDEKKGSDVKRRIIYRADTKMGSILLMQESVLKEDEKWHMKFAFLSNDRKQKYMITKNNRGNIKNLRDQIKKQCP